MPDQPKLPPCPWCEDIKPETMAEIRAFKARGLNVDDTIQFALRNYDDMLRRLANDATTNTTCTCNPKYMGMATDCPMHGVKP